MLKSFNEFSELLKNGKFRILNKILNEVINTYNFFHISEKIDQELPVNKNIMQNIKESKVVVINQSEEEDFFIISFKKTILIIKKSSLFLLDDFFSQNEKLKICFLSQKDDFYIKKNRYLTHYEETFVDLKEINEFNIHLFSTNNNLKQMFSCISAYLIKSSYLNITQDRLDYFNSSEKEKNEQPLEYLELNDDNFIFLRNIGIGATFRVDLVYHIKREKLFAKKIQHLSDEEAEKLTKRETENYESIQHPFLPKFYGWNKQENFFIIEFIKGETLDNIHNLNLNENDKITIIFELLIIFEYLHRNHFIYRDLKPNNVMIEDNKTIVLLDFDRMLNSNKILDENVITSDFQSAFTAAEIKSGNFSYEKSDIYSIGKIINFILNDKKQDESCLIDIDDLDEMYKECTNKNPEKRPSIFQLVFVLYLNHYSQIKIHNFFRRNKEYLKSSYDEEIIDLMIKYELDSNDPDVLYSIGLVYGDGKYVKRDIDKAHKLFFKAATQNHQASMLIINSLYQPNYFQITDIKSSIEYITNSANQNHLLAIYTLGMVYNENIYVPEDISKSIYYFTLASKQSFQESNVSLASIFWELNNLSKCIEYLNKAADQNFPFALLFLGDIYFSKEYGLQDINKAFDFYHRASEANSIMAQFKLGNIYLNGEYVQPNIDKAIYYFKLAADQGYALAQYQLGLIYYNKDINKNSDFHDLSEKINGIKEQYKQSAFYVGKYESPEIDKAIYYFTLAADQGYAFPQYQLGLIYINKDINKSIHYFKLAAEQNFTQAQYQLGQLYEKGEKIQRDLDKAIYYYKQASESNTEAYFRLGCIYEYSLFDFNKAIENYTQAASRNHPIAQLYLGHIYYSGRYEKFDIQKAIYYYTLSANQDIADAQLNLGEIYAECEYVKKDIKKAIYYFELLAKKNVVEAIFRLFIIYAQQNNIPKAIDYLHSAAKFNDSRAQFNLGVMYHEGKYVKRDINLAIYYYKLASDQNYNEAKYNLSIIYLFGTNGMKDINKAIYYLSSLENDSRAQYVLGEIYLVYQYGRYDINKAIYHLSKSAEKNYPQAHYILGQIYSTYDYDKYDIHKAIYYLTRSSNLNFPDAQFKLGLIYIEGEFIPKNIKRGISLIELASNNKNIMAYFVLGFLYHEGKFIKRDIDKAIKYYKEGSSFNNQYAKNNLGIIYREYKNINYSIALFREAININDDVLAGYNLAHIYLYGDYYKEDIDEAIKLLVSPTIKGFNSAKMLISLALIKKVGFDIFDIRNTFEKYCRSVEIINKVCFFIKEINLNCETVFFDWYKSYRQCVFIYNHLNNVAYSFKLKEEKKELKVIDINSQFYDGFGHDLMLGFK